MTVGSRLPLGFADISRLWTSDPPPQPSVLRRAEGPTGRDTATERVLAVQRWEQGQAQGQAPPPHVGNLPVYTVICTAGSFAFSQYLTEYPVEPSAGTV